MTKTIKKIIAKLNVKDKNKIVIVAAFLVGIILIVLSTFETKTVSEEETAQQHTTIFSEEEYCTALENKLESMVSSLSGAGKAKVIVTLECDYETIYAKDGSYSRDDLSSDEESQYIIIDSSEQEGGLVLKTVAPKIRGVAVLCEGGADPQIKAAISEMLSALLDVGKNNISISKIQ